MVTIRTGLFVTLTEEAEHVLIAHVIKRDIGKFADDDQVTALDAALQPGDLSGI